MRHGRAHRQRTARFVAIDQGLKYRTDQFDRLGAIRLAVEQLGETHASQGAGCGCQPIAHPSKGGRGEERFVACDQLQFQFLRHDFRIRRRNAKMPALDAILCFEQHGGEVRDFKLGAAENLRRVGFARQKPAPMHSRQRNRNRAGGRPILPGHGHGVAPQAIAPKIVAQRAQMQGSSGKMRGECLLEFRPEE